MVVTWNSADEIQGLVESVNEHLGEACDLLFVDNASTDGTDDLIRALTPDSRLIALSRNVGFGPASNEGVRATDAEVVALLNPDTVMVDSSLADLAELAAQSRSLHGPRLLNEDGSPQISAFPPLAGWESGLIAVCPGTLLPRRVRQRCEPWRFEQRLEVGWLSGACLVARRDLLLELGPFDSRLTLFGEDADLGLRAAQDGVASVFAPDVARVRHLGSRSGSQSFTDMGAQRKIDARRWIVRNRLGRARGAYDFVSQFLLHALRWIAKSALRRDRSIEASWLRAAMRSLAHRPKQPDALS